MHFQQFSLCSEPFRHFLTTNSLTQRDATIGLSIATVIFAFFASLVAVGACFPGRKYLIAMAVMAMIAGKICLSGLEPI